MHAKNLDLNRLLLCILYALFGKMHSRMSQNISRYEYLDMFTASTLKTLIAPMCVSYPFDLVKEDKEL